MTTKEKILALLRDNKTELKRFGISTVGLFGSYSRNETTEKSDIDIIIDFEPGKESFDNYMAVYDLLEALFEGEKIDVVTKNGLSPYIGPKILEEARYV